MFQNSLRKLLAFLHIYFISTNAKKNFSYSSVARYVEKGQIRNLCFASFHKPAKGTVKLTDLRTYLK